MLVLMIRTLILYLTVTAAMRIMGKRQIGEMQPSELVVAIMISDLASVPMQSIDQPLMSGIVPVLTLLVCEVGMSFLCLKSRRLRKFVAGEPSVVICDGHINEGELARLRFNLNDLLEQLRLAGCPCIYDVRTAILETNGKLSVIDSKEENIRKMPFMLVCDGRVDEAELARAGKTRAWLRKRIGCDESEIFIAVLDDSGSMFVQKKGEKDRV